MLKHPRGEGSGGEKPGVGRYELEKFASDLMKERRVISVVELEQECLHEFLDRWTAADLKPMSDAKGNEKKRLRWQNQVDWIKAHWTDQHYTVKAEFGGENYLIWMPNIGSIQGPGSLIQKREAKEIIVGLLRAFEKRLEAEDE